MQVVYTGEQAPTIVTKSIFLAGPSPRKASDPNWRVDAFKILKDLGYTGVVYAPIWRDGPPNESGKPFDYDGQVEWETKYLNACDVIVFWVPRDMESLPGLTTNVEYGMWLNSGKIVLGYPNDAEHMRYLDWQARQNGVHVRETLDDTLTTAMNLLGRGAARVGGERDIPLHLWDKPEFQTWYSAQKKVGNTLNGATVSWSFRVGKNKERIFLWALHVNVHIKAENRDKINEVVIFRPDISTIVAYCPPTKTIATDELHTEIMDTEIVLVSEFRSPANNPTSMVKEVPGGSSFKPGTPPETTASEEMHEETGLRIESHRFKPVGVRQIAATLAAHRAHCYAVELTPDEMLQLKWEAGKAHGNHADTEYTFVEVTTVADLLKNPNVDWSNLGMIFQALSK